MNWFRKLFCFCFTALKAALLFFALFCLFGGLDNLLNPSEPSADFGRILDIFLGVVIWLIVCQIHLPLWMRRR